MVRHVLPLGIGVFAAGVVVALSLADGGFFRWTWPWATLALAAASAGVWLIAGAGRVTGREAAFVLGLASLSAWQALSSLWSPDPARSLDDALRGTVYVAAAAAFVVLVRAAGPRPVLAGLTGGIALTLAVGLVQHGRGGGADPFQGSLLHQPVGYANAVGILAVLGALLAIGLLLEERSAVTRSALGAAVVLDAAALVLTQSRGAWLAGGIGLATMIAFRATRRPPVRAGWLAVVGLVVVAILVLPLLVEPARLHGILSDRAHYWPVAWHSLGSPLRGIGSGAFAQLWALERPVSVNAIDAHSLFLEALLELGAVGLAVVVATTALPLLAAFRLAGGWTAAATGAYAAFLVHAAVDWDWELPAVTVAGLACGAALLAHASSRHPGSDA